jgi:hypothetical protein
MVKRILFAGFLAVSSFVSFSVGQGGGTTNALPSLTIQGPPEAAACNAFEYMYLYCACDCCDECWLWGDYCNGCTY